MRVVSRRGTAGFMELRRHGATILEKPFERRAGRRWWRVRLPGSLMRQLLRAARGPSGWGWPDRHHRAGAGAGFRHRAAVTLMPS